MARESETAPPREVLMAARFVVLCVGVFALMTSSSWATDAVDSVATLNASEATAAPENSGPQPSFEPKISAEMSTKNRDQLVVGFQVALEKVREVPECSELFTGLGADGIDTLGKVYFFPIGYHEAKANVCHGSIAYTLVGGGPTWVCRDFWRLTDREAAMIIIHEALHHAGLPERPGDPDAMTSAGINRMVIKNCGL
jgi:hypothetical protein